MSRQTSKRNRNSIGTDSLRFAVNDFSVYDNLHTSKDLSLRKITDLSKTLMDEQDWYDKDLNDFDDPQSTKENEERIIQSKQKNQISTIENNYHGKEYPFDLWYLIGTYIPPEDIGRFALICRKTNQVINTTAFWISLFRKYNKIEAKRLNRILLREHLTVVRTHVIKSLYQSYPLFKERFDKADAIQKDPHFLLSSRCVRIWFSKRPTQRELYNYYFEFRSDDIQPSKKEDIQIQPLSPIFQANNRYIVDKDSCILHLITSNFVSVGSYMGMILSNITFNVSSDYRYHKLKMWFDSSKVTVQKSKYNNSMITIDPVLCLRIYKWYNCPDNLD